MSKKEDISSFTASNLNPKVAKQLAKIDKIIKKATDTDKRKLIKDGLPVKPMTEDIIEKVDIKKIVHSTYFIRSKVFESFDDLDMVTKADPIKVVVTDEKERYFLIDGQRRLRHAKGNDEKQVHVQIIGTVVCQSQIGMARGKEMVKFKKPLTPVELVYGLMQLKDQLIRDFGEKAFFVHGGDRKSNNDSQQSLPGYIAEVLGIKKTTVDTLIRFGSNVGPMGLEGLLTKKDMVSMALREINQINVDLKTADLTGHIDARINQLIEAGATQEHLIVEAGELASNKIFQALNAPASNDNDNDDDDNEGETDSNYLPDPPKNKPKGKNGSSKGNNGSEHLSSKRKSVKLSDIVKIISGIENVLKKLKNDLDKCKRVEKIDKPIFEAKWELLGDYWGDLCVKVANAGLS